MAVAVAVGLGAVGFVADVADVEHEFGLRAEAVAGEQAGDGVGALAAARVLAAASAIRMVSRSVWVSLCRLRPPPNVQPLLFSGCVS